MLNVLLSMLLVFVVTMRGDRLDGARVVGWALGPVGLLMVGLPPPFVCAQIELTNPPVAFGSHRLLRFLLSA